MHTGTHSHRHANAHKRTGKMKIHLFFFFIIATNKRSLEILCRARRIQENTQVTVHKPVPHKQKREKYFYGTDEITFCVATTMKQNGYSSSLGHFESNVLRFIAFQHKIQFRCTHISTQFSKRKKEEKKMWCESHCCVMKVCHFIFVFLCCGNNEHAKKKNESAVSCGSIWICIVHVQCSQFIIQAN